MQVRVRFFAGTREAVGASALAVELPEGARLSDLVERLVAQHPRLAAYAHALLLAQDGRVVTPGEAVREGAEVALMPPVSGGSGDTLSPEPFSLDEMLAEASREACGAVASFVGLVRASGGEDPRERVARLHFEAYEPMARAEIERIREEAVAKFGLGACLVRHRLGTLEVGEPIVAVVASAPHRRDAFAAVAWVMDELKTRVPIWKQEEGPAGRRWIRDPRENPHA